MQKNKLIFSGMKEVAPLLIGAIPFGASTGIYSVESGFSILESVLMSVFIFAGASQVATVNLLSNDAPFWIVVGTAVIINLRFLIYSASVAPYLSQASRVLRPFLSYSMTDHSFIITTRKKHDGSDKTYQFLGAGMLVWLVWQSSFLAGSIFGKVVPDNWSLDFSLPLVFLFFTVPLLNSRPNIVAASVAGTGSIIFIPVLPLHSGMIVSILMGAIAGIVAKKLSTMKEKVI